MNHRTHALQENSIEPPPAVAGKEQGLGIEELTARAGVSERLVRHCETHGLIPGAKEANASWRRYTQEDVCVLRFARQAHVLGFGMNEVARLLYLWQDMHRISSALTSIDLARSDELELRNDKLQAMECVLGRLTDLFLAEHQPTCPIFEELIEIRGAVCDADEARCAAKVM